MGRSILTTGRIAEKPYRIRIIDRNVYTVEELCYSLAQCASFLDEDLMDHELLVWLEESCGLAELASQLRSLLRGRCAVEDFASVILLYVGYQSVAEIERIRASISSGKGMEPFDCYGKAWRLSGSRQNCLRYLAALQFSIPEDAFAEYIGGHPELEDAAAELTRITAQAEREWKNGTAGRQNKRLAGYLRNGQAKSFDNYAQQRIRELRDQFRADNAPSF